jgi:hypothetical protein
MADKNVRPWDLFNKKMGRVDSETYKKRIEICQACPELIKTTFQCKKCGCFMKQKNKLADASCPLNKWGKFKIEEVSRDE